MAIRDTWRRVRGKPESSPGSSQSGPSVGTGIELPPADDVAAAATAGPKTPGTETPSFLSKTFSWRSAASGTGADGTPASPKKTSKRSKRPPAPPRHPSERPLSEANLRHQELLSSFTMTFGRRRSSAAGRSWRSSFSGVSPGASRQPSLAVPADDGTHPYAHNHHHHHPEPRRSLAAKRLSSALKGEVPREESEGEEARAEEVEPPREKEKKGEAKKGETRTEAAATALAAAEPRDGGRAAQAGA